MYSVFSILLDAYNKRSHRELFKDRYITSVMSSTDILDAIKFDIRTYKSDDTVLLHKDGIIRHLGIKALNKYVLIISDKNVIYCYHIVVRYFNEDSLYPYTKCDKNKNFPICMQSDMKIRFEAIRSQLIEELVGEKILH